MNKIKSQYLIDLIESLDDGIITISKNLNINFYNNKALYFLGAKSCILYKNIFDFFPKLKSTLINFKGTSIQSILLSSKDINFNCDIRKIYSSSNEDLGFILVLRELITVNRFVSNDAIYKFHHIIGESEALKSVLTLAQEISISQSTILISGESGSGKELLAQSIHNESLRKNEPFIVINCGAIPKPLVELELFGYEEGTFSGSKLGGKPGKFELANGGTIFLDEIGEMPLEMQFHLLRVLKEGTITRIGGKSQINVNVRVIAATNKNLKEEIKNGRFREDLFYRLNVIPLKVPSLKDRIGDIPILINYFLEVKSKKLNKPIPKISERLFKKMLSYCWPGNIRELENCVENIVNLNGKTSYEMNFDECTCLDFDNLGNPIEYNCDDVSCAICNPKETKECVEPLKSLLEVEKLEIKKALRYFDGNMTKASHHLGISRNALYNKIKRHNIKK